MANSPYKTDEKTNWIFTFGSNHAFPKRYVKIYGTYQSARSAMMKAFGSKWAFQYSEQEWNEKINSPRLKYLGFVPETEIYIEGLSTKTA